MHSKKQYLQELQKDYLAASKIEKINLLDEAVKRTGMVRKYIIRRLSAKTKWEKTLRKSSSRFPEYTSDLIAPLVRIWDIFDHPCGQRLAPLIYDELERLRELKELRVTDQQAEKLKAMCSKTIDTLLSHEKEVRLLNFKYQKKNNPLLYQRIPTKMSDEWNREIPGQIQIDAVEHCGQTAIGEYLNTISHTDISSHWWEGEAIMGKGQQRTVQAVKDCRQRFPLVWDEIHPDNGTSFINYLLYDYAKDEAIEFSRSRPYQKNDNCFVEQKNSQNVRKHVGYVRYDTEKEQIILNDLYRHELRLYKNYFQSVMRLETKERNKGHIYRKYQKAKTPYRWLMENTQVPKKTKQLLKAQYDSLNPAELKRRIDIKLKLLAKVYQAKQHFAERMPQTETLKVTFLNYPTTCAKLPSLIT